MYLFNKKLLAILIGILVYNVAGYSQIIDSTFHIYVLMGQSNMAGRGEITPELEKCNNENVFMLDSNSHWVRAHHPVHFDKPKVAGVGPGLSFGITMAEANPSIRIGLVPCAVGGTSIEKWRPDAFDKATQTHPYDDAVVRIKEAMKYGIIKGIIWHQGESDSSEEKAKKYLEQLSELIQRMRDLVGNPNLPFIAGELGNFKPQYQDINSVLKYLPEKIGCTAVVGSEGLVDKGDKTHFDGPSANELGIRFAKKMQELQLFQISIDEHNHNYINSITK